LFFKGCGGFAQKSIGLDFILAPHKPLIPTFSLSKVKMGEKESFCVMRGFAYDVLSHFSFLGERNEVRGWGVKA